MTMPSTGTLSPGRTQEDVAAAHLLDRHEPLGRVRVVGVEQPRLRARRARASSRTARPARLRALGLAPARDQERGDDDRAHVVVERAC